SSLEWLETDEFDGFASGTATGIRTRRYHALLLTATTAPASRMALVNGFDALVETPAGSFGLTSQYYSPDVITDTGAQRIKSFTVEPWPSGMANHYTSRWEHELSLGLRSLRDRFWNEERGFLNDLVDVNHEPGTFEPILAHLDEVGLGHISEIFD